jgi:hypothetical protein
MIPDHLVFRSQQPDTMKTDDIWHTTFCGVPAVQAWQDFMLWERFLNEAKPKTIIEIGTFEGGFSLYLYFQAYSRNALFYTVDFMNFAKFDDETSPLFVNGLKSFFLHVDVWSDAFQGFLQRGISDPLSHPVVLFCDGGNKPKEMQTFSPRLSVGDYLAVHDWSHECSDADLEGLPIEKVLQSECESLNSLTRFFKRV